MAFDASKDKVLASKTLDSFDNGASVVTVGVYSYNGGEPKLQIGRIGYLKSGEARHRKLGRMTLQESMAVAQVVPEILKQIG